VLTSLIVCLIYYPVLISVVEKPFSLLSPKRKCGTRYRKLPRGKGGGMYLWDHYIYEYQYLSFYLLLSPFRIVLDESVIPQKYARVLVRALYVDSIDFDLVDEKSVEIGDR